MPLNKNEKKEIDRELLIGEEDIETAFSSSLQDGQRMKHLEWRGSLTKPLPSVPRDGRRQFFAFLRGAFMMNLDSTDVMIAGRE